MSEPGMTSLAGGLPNPSLFPFVKADIEILDPGSSLSPDDATKSGHAGPETTYHLLLDRYGDPSQNTLSKAMQYSKRSVYTGVLTVQKPYIRHLLTRLRTKPEGPEMPSLLEFATTSSRRCTNQLVKISTFCSRAAIPMRGQKLSSYFVNPASTFSSSNSCILRRNTSIYRWAAKVCRSRWTATAFFPKYWKKF